MDEFKKLVFIKANVDVAKDVAKQCGITAMPTFQLFNGDKHVDTQKGWSERGTNITLFILIESPKKLSIQTHWNSLHLFFIVYSIIYFELF